MLVVSTLAATLLGACTSSPSAVKAAQTLSVPTSDIPVAASRVAAGCGSTPIMRGPIPKWLVDASGDNYPADVPWVISSPPIAGGFLFTYPLVAPANGRGSKILWAMRLPRNGTDLTIDAHPGGSSSPDLHFVHGAGSGPGEIYPDGAELPSPGCWHFTLLWAGHRATLDLQYRAA